jgi:hypothetical protein
MRAWLWLWKGMVPLPNIAAAYDQSCELGGNSVCIFLGGRNSRREQKLSKRREKKEAFALYFLRYALEYLSYLTDLHHEFLIIFLEYWSILIRIHEVILDFEEASVL